MPPTMRSIARCGLLLLAAASPSLALSLSVLPARPVEEQPFILVIGLVGGCPVPDGIVVTPGNPGEVTVKLIDPCPAPGRPTLLEVPIGPLTNGAWNLRVDQEWLQVNVERAPYRVEVDPPFPQAGSPFKVRLTGSGTCPFLVPAVQDGNLLTLLFDDNCPVVPLPPSPFVVEQSAGPLPAADYAVQVKSFAGRTLASNRFHMFDTFECTPSETALCLQRGRFRVEATWRTATAQGVARVRPETADSGSLWFFAPENLELLVKVLDACQTRAPAIWVFAAGLTNVDVELTVTDVAKGLTRTYHNPLGTSFAPILDTTAFPCPWPPPPPNV